MCLLLLAKKIRQTRPSWTAQYFSLSFVGQICKFNALLGTKNYNSSLAFWLEQIRQTWCPLASSVWQGTLGQKFDVPLKEKTNFVWIGTKSYNSFLASFLWDFSATSVWHEKLDKLGHLLLAGKLDVLLTENNQKSVSLSVVGYFRINCSFWQTRDPLFSSRWSPLWLGSELLTRDGDPYHSDHFWHHVGPSELTDAI